MNDDVIKKRTQKTTTKLFGTGIKMDPPYMLWKEFDRGLANDFSLFITGNLYSRNVERLDAPGTSDGLLRHLGCNEVSR
jgi:4-carboxymuconolactone decarboxylase